MISVPTPNSTALQTGEFSGRLAFEQAIRGACEQASAQAWREMIWIDPSFEDWPLGERAVEQSLQAWSQSGRKLTLIAIRFDALIARHHRFVQWRKQWSHIVEARAVPTASSEEFLSALWSPAWCLQRLQMPASKGLANIEAERRMQLRLKIDDWLAKSTSAFPATTLGL